MRSFILYKNNICTILFQELPINASVTLSATPDDFNSLQGQLLIAMPQMEDPRFQQAVMIVLEHDANGAMGLIINRPLLDLTFDDLLQQIRNESSAKSTDIPQPAEEMTGSVPIFFGGPVEIGRGFVLHSPDIILSTTRRVQDALALTTSLDMIDMIARNKGPQKAILALGYAGWGAGQLETEMQANAWLNAPFQQQLIFDTPSHHIWDKALNSVGVTLTNLSTSTGHA